MQGVVKSLVTVVGVPTLISILYFGIFASDIYVSEARIAIRSSDGSSGAVTGIAALLTSPGGSGSGQETSVVKDYMHSADMLQKLRDRLELQKHYSSRDIDMMARLAEEVTNEELLEYMTSRIEVFRDTASDVITLKTRAFSPEMSQSVAQQVIALSEDLVNRMSSRMEEDALRTAHSEVDRAYQKVSDVGERLSNFRNVNRSVDPASESSALMGLLSGIEGKIVEARTELQEKQAYMRDSAPEVIALKNRLNALRKQLTIEKSRLIGDEDDNRELTHLVDDYRPLVIEQDLAQQQFASALTSLEVARAEASRKKQYLITFIEPNLPDEALEPQRIKMILTVMVFSFLIYSIGALMWSALKDHVGR